MIRFGTGWEGPMIVRSMNVCEVEYLDYHDRLSSLSFFALRRGNFLLQILHRHNGFDENVTLSLHLLSSWLDSNGLGRVVLVQGDFHVKLGI